MNEVTRIINAIEHGDSGATEELLPLVYEELRLLAAEKLSKELPGQTLQATALVHEAYVRLIGSDNPGWDSRGHFFAAAAESMRRILIDNARRKKTERHDVAPKRQLFATWFGWHWESGYLILNSKAPSRGMIFTGRLSFKRNNSRLSLL